MKNLLIILSTFLLFSCDSLPEEITNTPKENVSLTLNHIFSFEGETSDLNDFYDELLNTGNNQDQPYINLYRDLTSSDLTSFQENFTRFSDDPYYGSFYSFFFLEGEEKVKSLMDILTKYPHHQQTLFFLLEEVVEIYNGEENRSKKDRIILRVEKYLNNYLNEEPQEVGIYDFSNSNFFISELWKDSFEIDLENVSSEIKLIKERIKRELTWTPNDFQVFDRENCNSCKDPVEYGSFTGYDPDYSLYDQIGLKPKVRVDRFGETMDEFIESNTDYKKREWVYQIDGWVKIPSLPIKWGTKKRYWNFNFYKEGRSLSGCMSNTPIWINFPNPKESDPRLKIKTTKNGDKYDMYLKNPKVVLKYYGMSRCDRQFYIDFESFDQILVSKL